jgi:hypothetical protein
MHKNGSVGVFDKWRRCQANGQKIQPINNAFAHSQKRNIFGQNRLSRSSRPPLIFRLCVSKNIDNAKTQTMLKQSKAGGGGAPG